jgi:hypothetical protein
LALDVALGSLKEYLLVHLQTVHGFESHIEERSEPRGYLYLGMGIEIFSNA